MTGSNGSDATRRWPRAEEIRSRLVELLAAELRVEPAGVDVAKPVAAYGFDSIFRVSLVSEIEAFVGRPIEGSMLSDEESIAALAERIAAAGAPGPERLEHSAGYSDLLARGIELATQGLANPFFRAIEGPAGATVQIGGRTLTSFATYDYLGLASHPYVVARARAALDAFGTSASGSRLVGGERPIHAELEQALAALLGTEDAVGFVGGHATNVSVIGHLLRPGDLFVHDVHMHQSAIAGATLAGARRLAFPHNDWRFLDALLEARRGQHARILVAIEGVYSADGDLPDLHAFVRVKERHGACLLVDEAHSLGTLGASGRGIGEHLGVEPEAVELWMGTLSKALASCGGYIAGRRTLCEYLRYTCGGFVFAAGMSPANAAAALGAIEVLRREPERVARLSVASRRFAELARAHGLQVRGVPGAPVVPVMVGGTKACVAAANALHDRGILVQPLLPPAVDEGAARLRFFLSSEHTEAQLRQAAQATADVLSSAAPAPSTPRIEGGGGRAVLVTGGNGFIGSVVVRRLVERGHRVRLLLRASSRTDRLAGCAFERVLGDIRDPAAVRRALRGTEGAIHLAGLSSWADIASPHMHDVVVGGTWNLLAGAAAESVGRVVYVSSSVAINGAESPRIFDETSPSTLPRGRYAYALAKLEAERLCREAVASGTSVTIVNPCEVYGPSDDLLVTSGTLLDFARARAAVVCEGGTSVVHVEDVADGILAALEHGRPAERYILGGDNLSVRALAELTQSLCGRVPRVVEIPRPVLRTAARLGSALGLPLPFEPAVIPYASLYWFMDSGKAQRELGARFRPAREVLAPTLAWLRQAGHLPER